MKLIRLLRRAHAIEIGAFHAYEGHWKSLPKDSIAQNTIKAIQQDEVVHRAELYSMLTELGTKQSKLQDATLWCIGKTISAACHIMGYRAAMWGAKIMEVMGASVYESLARAAREEQLFSMANKLDEMQRAETYHSVLINILMDARKKAA